MADDRRLVRASSELSAPAAAVFELIADPALQPQWDGNDNLARADAGQRVRAVGDVFTTTLTIGAVRENHVVEFAEGRLLAWMPAEPGGPPVGHLWRWQVEPLEGGGSRVIHTYDWTRLADPGRIERARWTRPDRLRASIDGLARVAERAGPVR